jgi:hypothetical protein
MSKWTPGQILDPTDHFVMFILGQSRRTQRRFEGNIQHCSHHDAPIVRLADGCKLKNGSLPWQDLSHNQDTRTDRFVRFEQSLPRHHLTLRNDISKALKSDCNICMEEAPSISAVLCLPGVWRLLRSRVIISFENFAS